MVNNTKKMLPALGGGTVYNEAVTCVSGNDLLESNIRESKAIAHMIAPMFGPDGLYKLITRGHDELEITQKGSSVAKLFKTRLPVVQMLVKLAEFQERECGDGTKTALLLTGLFLDKARDMLAQGMHPHTINEGFSLATRRALEILEDCAIPLETTDDLTIRGIFTSILARRIPVDVQQHCFDLAMQIMKRAKITPNGTSKMDLNDIQFRKVPGRSMLASEVVEGVIINKQKPVSSLPDKIEHPRVILVQSSLDLFTNDSSKTGVETDVRNVAKLVEFSQYTKNYYDNLAAALQAKGVNVILCQKQINESLISSCAARGIIALELVGEEPIKNLSRVLDKGPVATVRDLSRSDIADASLVEFRRFTKDEMCIITSEKSKISTFVLRGGTNAVLNVLEESLKSALAVIMQSLNDQKVLPGGGALDCEIAFELQRLARTLPNKLQIVVSEYAKALESIPGYIVMNSGNDPVDVVTSLKAAHESGDKWAGFNCNANSIVDTRKATIFDGYKVKKQALRTSVDVACQIVRVNDMIMVHDRALFEKKEQEIKDARNVRRNEKLRKYMKTHEVDMSTP